MRAIIIKINEGEEGKVDKEQAKEPKEEELLFGLSSVAHAMLGETLWNIIFGGADNKGNGHVVACLMMTSFPLCCI